MVFTECLLDALVDTLRLLPFLFLTYLAMEYLEHRAGNKSVRIIRKTGRLGPLVGAAAGVGASVRLFCGGIQPLFRRSDHHGNPAGSSPFHFG